MEYSVKHVPLADRPREKLARVGASALGDNELLAIVLGQGTRRRGSLVLAQEVLAKVGSAAGLLTADLDVLRQIPGIGAANAARIVAASELGRRVVCRPVGERPKFTSGNDTARYLLPLYGGYRVERFGLVLLDTKRRLIRTTIVSVGALDGTYASPREVFREALVASAGAVVLFHNHPSGDPAPSADDVQLTRRLQQAGDIVGVPVVDHIILGRDRYFSFAESTQL
jgi:DNA repair protein RadC